MTEEITKLASELLDSLPVEEQIRAADYLKHVLKAEQENKQDDTI